MTGRTRLACLGTILTGLLSLAAGPKQAPAARGDSDFWMNIAQPGRKQYLEALKKGRELFEAGIRMRMPSTREQTLLEARAQFQRAIKHHSAGAQAHYWAGKVAYALDRMKEAIAAFNAMRRLQPDSGDEFGVAFKLGIAYSKLGRFEEAVEEYNRVDRLLQNESSSRGSNRSIMHANAAESLMALGRLDEAVQRYRESITADPANVLAWWGLAVAQDRDEQVSKAREAVGRALDLDPGMSRLTEDSVFFVPDGDIHYYFALGYQAKGDLMAARREWETFLAKLPGSAWVFRARQHLKELSSGSAASSSKRLVPLPRTQHAALGESLAHEQNQARYRIQGYLYRIRQCYQKELKAVPALAGQLRLGITVNKDGKPTEVKVVQSTVKRQALIGCVVNTIKTITFNRSSSGAPLRFTFPMEFKAVQ